MSLSVLITQYGNLIVTAGAGIGGWCANMVRSYLLAQRQRLDAGQQALAVLDRATARDETMDALLVRMTTRVDELMQTRWRLDDVVQDLYAQAISARMIVHELDAAACRAPRDFERLPAYPLPVSVYRDNATSPPEDTPQEPAHDAG